MAIVTMKQLLEAGIHFGHQTRRWHPKMKRFIYGQRNGIYIIDLQHTLRQIYKSYGMVREVTSRGGNILFVGTKRQAQEVIQQEAKRSGQYYVTSRWLGGTLTNFRTVKLSIGELNRLQELETSGKIEKYKKREALEFRNRRERLEKNLSGIQHMPGLPDLIFVASVKNENIAVLEGKRLGIPVIGIVDTNCDPDLVDVPIPGNDDAMRALGLYCSILADAAIEGRAKFSKGRGDDAEQEMLAAAGEAPTEDAVEEETAELAPVTADTDREEEEEA